MKPKEGLGLQAIFWIIMLTCLKTALNRHLWGSMALLALLGLINAAGQWFMSRPARSLYRNPPPPMR